MRLFPARRLKAELQTRPNENRCGFACLLPRAEGRILVKLLPRPQARRNECFPRHW
jgi:hypothetical protein